MLLRFGVENYRSFRNYTEVSFVSTAQHDAPEWRIPASGVQHGVLPVIALFGANASGKSNLLQALKDFLGLVEHSFTLRQQEPIPWTPWRMNRVLGAPATRYDADLFVDGVRYHYGFRFTATRFEEEWLYSWPDAHKQVLFHRNYEEENPWYFGRNFRGSRHHLIKATAPNNLFLSVAGKFAHETLGRVAEAFTASCKVEAPIELHGHPIFHQASPLLDPRLKETVQEVLQSADLGIANLQPHEEQELSTEELALLRETLSEKAFEDLSKKVNQKATFVALWLLHTLPGEEPWELHPQFESRGTQVLLARLNDILGALQNGNLLILDEIDTSLHPDLCAALVALFTNAETNPKGAQLLFSTHNRDLLEGLRRDEVVLVDKGSDGQSTLRVASDYRGLRGRDDLRRTHAQGRIGGVPVLGDIATPIEQVHSHAP